MKRKILTVLLALVMVVGLLPMAALAAEPLPAEADPAQWDTIKLTRTDGTELVEDTDYTISYGTYYHYAYSERFKYHIYNITTSDPIVISGGGQYKGPLTNPLKSRITLGADVISVTFKDVTALGELSIAEGSRVTFTLEGANNVDYIYGVGASTNMTFEGSGSLTGKHIGGVNKYGAAKGTNIGCNITINSGTFDITAGYESAIGGGRYGDSGTITINGGKITAKSSYGAAIGGGQSGDAGTIIITDGEVNAVGSFGAAIGGGQNGDATEIKIDGGTIDAKGSHVGAAIGGGQNGDAQKIEITDGDITITARKMAVGGSNAGNISISGGTFDIKGLDSSSKEIPADASQIGAASGGQATEVTISGGKFSCDISSLVTEENTPVAKVEANNQTTYVVGGTSIADAANSGEDVTVVKAGEITGLEAGKTINVADGVDGVTVNGNEVAANASYTEPVPIPAYSVKVAAAENGAVTSNRRSATRGQTVTLTVSPADGYALDSLTVTDAKGNEIELTDKGDGKYTFKMPASRVTVTATFKKVPVFTDVEAGRWYTEAIEWAAEEGIVWDEDGSGLFNPDADCTRAAIVTFLWRAFGAPEPTITECPFTDVSKSDPWYKAVLWAYENKITVGYDSTTVFAPDATSERAQTLTFLKRAVKAADVETGNDFTDVPEGAWYETAVNWGVSEGLTNGYDDPTVFAPHMECSRAQIIAFIYRLLHE